ncbi:hypothetical protein F4778DRAFT_798641 [Xylariomycetidae sp. FL2044]|nr:hypothetical protein F4778DRAFT_798641 [Xylariomycetidae sp. FL2044]
MAPFLQSFGSSPLQKRVDRPSDPDALVLEAWAQGYMVSGLIIMSFITLANMRKGVLLHKLILLELLLGIGHGFWIFFHDPIYSWWLSVSAIFLNISWVLHNVIAFMKIKPFLPETVKLIYIVTVALSCPYWIVEIYANFAYFHNINDIFLKTRPWEALCRLVYQIKTRYEISLREITRISPRFAVMLSAMAISIIFIIVDVCSVLGAFRSALPIGINPFWKIAFVFKCLTDSVILDDFKTALDRLRAWKMARFGSYGPDAVSASDRRTRNTAHYTKGWEELHHVSQNAASGTDGGSTGWKTTIVGSERRKDEEVSPSAISVATEILLKSSAADEVTSVKPPPTSHPREDNSWTESSDDSYPLRPLPPK